MSVSDKRASMTAVCYRCFYRGPAGETKKCPACDFALILEAAEPTREKHIEDIMGRYSVRDGAPKLPGIATHHGLPSATRPKFFAMGTVPPPHESVAAGPLANLGPAAHAQPVVITAPAAHVKPPIPTQVAQGSVAAPLPTRELEVSEITVIPTEPERAGIRVVEILCVILGAVAAGVGAAVLHTAF